MLYNSLGGVSHDVVHTRTNQKDLPLAPGPSAGVICVVQETRKEGFMNAVGEQGGEFMAPGFKGFN